jgi:hypothetical protein
MGCQSSQSSASDQRWGSALPFISGGSWANPQNLPTHAQVNVLERARWTLP